jgi:hypothetical protein
VNAISHLTDSAELRSLARDCAAAGVRRRVLLVRLDRLPAHLTRPHHLRLVRAALDPLASGDRGRLYNLRNGALAIVWRGGLEESLEQAKSALLHLLADRRGAAPDLLELFDLPERAPALLAALASDAPELPVRESVRAEEQSFDPEALAGIELALAQADVATFARRKKICRDTGLGFALAWEKRFLSIDELAATVAPDHAPEAEPWLFRRLTRTLDRRMLVLLAAQDELRWAGPFALNLNVASILSPEFLRFDAMLPGALRGQVVLNLLACDILTDPGAFAFARDFARARGYRLLLRGITAGLLPLLPLPALGLDYVQLRWSPALARANEALFAPECTVLSRVDDEDALGWGRARGIPLFQGAIVRP